MMKLHNQWDKSIYKSQPIDWLAIRTSPYGIQFYIAGYGLSVRYKR